MKMIRIHRRNLKQMSEIWEALVLQRKKGGELSSVERCGLNEWLRRGRKYPAPPHLIHHTGPYRQRGWRQASVPYRQAPWRQALFHVSTRRRPLVAVKGPTARADGGGTCKPTASPSGGRQKGQIPKYFQTGSDLKFVTKKGQNMKFCHHSV